MIRNPELQAAMELLFASLLWGFGFVATTWGLTAFSPPEFLFLRFMLAYLFGELLSFVINNNPIPRFEIQRGLIAGLLLGGVLIFQTWGLMYTTPTKSGFITSFYVVLVPILLHLFWKVKSNSKTYFNAFIALLGIFLLAMPAQQKGEPLNLTPGIGDVLTLICAFIGAIHIIYIDKYSKSIINPFRFNNYQSLSAAAFCLPFLLFQNSTQKINFSFLFNETQKNLLAVLGVIITALGASVLAFYLQIRTQKILKPTTASFFFLLEAPFALFFSVWLINEQIHGVQVIGIFLLIFSSLRQLFF